VFSLKNPLKSRFFSIYFSAKVEILKKFFEVALKNHHGLNHGDFYNKTKNRNQINEKKI
jgi:hypothetical protein